MQGEKSMFLYKLKNSLKEAKFEWNNIKVRNQTK